MIYNISGALVWGFLVTLLLGYFLGNQIPNSDSYLLLAVLLAVRFTFLSPIIHVLREQKTRSAIKGKLKEFLRYIKLYK